MTAAASSRVRWIVVAVVVVAVFVAARVLPVGEWLRDFQSWVAQRGIWGGVIYGIVYTVAVLLFVPGSVLTIGAGLVFGLLWGTVIVSLASTTAAALAFLIARYVARGRVEALAKRNQRFRAIDHAIREKGWRVVALLRLSPLVPFSVSIPVVSRASTPPNTWRLRAAARSCAPDPSAHTHDTGCNPARR